MLSRGIIRHRSTPLLLLASALCWNPIRRQQSLAGFPHQGPNPPPQTPLLLEIMASSTGGLDEMEASLNRSGLVVTPSLASHAINSVAEGVGGSRKLLRFLSWCRNNMSGVVLGDEVFNQAIKAFAKVKDITAMEIAISDLQKAGGKMDAETFSRAADALVETNKAEKAIRLFRCTKKQSQLLSSEVAIIHALCSKGHATEAQRIFRHHKDQHTDANTAVVYRSLLHGWCIHRNVKEARGVLKEMKSMGIHPGLASYHDVLRCLCGRNLKFNPSALVPEASQLMSEMRRFGVPPTAVTFNILLSSLARSRRVKEASKILTSMANGEAGCSPDWTSYYLVARILYLTKRFGRGHSVVDRMMDEGVVPEASFFRCLIGVLCGMKEVDHALEVFQRMKRCCMQETGPAFDLLITKICRSGKFDMGRGLWDEAVARGITLRCSSSLLDPSKTEVFKPVREVVESHKSDNSRTVKMRQKSIINRTVKARHKKECQ